MLCHGRGSTLQPLHHQAVRKAKLFFIQGPKGIALFENLDILELSYLFQPLHNDSCGKAQQHCSRYKKKSVHSILTKNCPTVFYELRLDGCCHPFISKRNYTLQFT